MGTTSRPPSSHVREARDLYVEFNPHDLPEGVTRVSIKGSILADFVVWFVEEMQLVPAKVEAFTQDFYIAQFRNADAEKIEQWSNAWFDKFWAEAREAETRRDLPPLHRTS